MGLAAVLRDSGADLVILSGYLRKVGPLTLNAFAGRVQSNTLVIDVAPKPPKKRGIIARLLG